MTHVRLSFFSTAFLFCSLYSSTNQLSLENTHAQQWGQLCYEHMSQQELQITANILYTLYSNALIDSTLQQLHTPIAHLTQAALLNISDAKNPLTDLATLKTLIERLSIIIGARTIYTQTLETCLAHYNDHQTAIVNEALEGLQLYVQNVLRAWAQENDTLVETHLKNCEDRFAESAQMFHAASEFHKDLKEGNLPVEVEENNKSLARIQVLLQSAHMLIKNTNAIANTINDSGDDAMGIVCIGTEIYKQHYQALYALLSSPSFDKQYATTMFSMHGLLPEEYVSLLPHPDHIFEHMLQTTKLYTQTEIVK